VLNEMRLVPINRYSLVLCSLVGLRLGYGSIRLKGMSASLRFVGLSRPLLTSGQ
jgi:hypothetical protein